MKKIFIISLLLLVSSCFIHQGRVIDGRCRPKHPHFKLKKVDFKKTDKLVFYQIYIADDFTKSMGYGFYPDGRLVFVQSKDGFDLKPDDVKNVNWTTARKIGYWRVKDSLIKIEYFLCGNSGFYLREKGFIKGDTVFFERVCGSNPFKTEICYDKYVLSSFKID